MRRDDDHMTKKVMNIEDGKRDRGRPPITWLRTFKYDIIASNTTKETTHNRTVWRRNTRKADHKLIGIKARRKKKERRRINTSPSSPKEDVADNHRKVVTACHSVTRDWGLAQKLAGVERQGLTTWGTST
ncbi:jg11868 [Pararge aegeria aegeria]|uniref:Jg11868 protein n=1 Tax=Pararge aegeria aegeria TaxID=348720 RepID=A0A8S4SJX1_9NEOP|nr:jg11868 [Pararge aegeria aegeria]